MASSWNSPSRKLWSANEQQHWHHGVMMAIGKTCVSANIPYWSTPKGLQTLQWRLSTEAAVDPPHNWHGSCWIAVNTPAHESSQSAAAHWSELGDAAIFTASKQCDPQERRRFRCKCRKEIISEEILGRSQGGWNQPDGSNQKTEREGTQNQVMLSNPIAHLLFLQEASNAWNHNNAMERSRGFEPLWACTNHERLQSMNTRKKENTSTLKDSTRERASRPGGSCGKNNFLKRDQQKTRRKEKINKKNKIKKWWEQNRLASWWK
jgi:hypothetical protein